MKEERVQILCINLISMITEFLIENSQKDTEALKIIKIAIDNVLSKKRKELR